MLSCQALSLLHCRGDCRVANSADGTEFNCMKNLNASKCGEETLARWQVPTKVTHHYPSTAGKSRENRLKGLWVKIRMGENQPIIVQAKQTRLGEINLFIAN